MLRMVTFFVLRAVQNSWGRDPDHVGSYSCVKKLTGVARLLLNRVGEVIRQLVTELARLHLAHLHLNLGKGNAFLESIITSDADPGSGNSPVGYKNKKIYLAQNSTLNFV